MKPITFEAKRYAKIDTWVCKREWFLCISELDRLFYIPEHVNKIWVTLSSTKTKESLAVKPTDLSSSVLVCIDRYNTGAFESIDTYSFPDKILLDNLGYGEVGYVTVRYGI